jgi:hypothetical protein
MAPSFILALRLFRELRLSRIRIRRKILVRGPPRCKPAVGCGLILKSLPEGWSTGFFGHPVKLGRLFQILTDELHDAIPSHAQFHLFDPQTIRRTYGSCDLEVRPEKGKCARDLRKVRRWDPSMA